MTSCLRDIFLFFFGSFYTSLLKGKILNINERMSEIGKKERQYVDMHYHTDLSWKYSSLA